MKQTLERQRRRFRVATRVSNILVAYLSIRTHAEFSKYSIRVCKSSTKSRLLFLKFSNELYSFSTLLNLIQWKRQSTVVATNQVLPFARTFRSLKFFSAHSLLLVTRKKFQSFRRNVNHVFRALFPILRFPIHIFRPFDTLLMKAKRIALFRAGFDHFPKFSFEFEKKVSFLLTSSVQVSLVLFLLLLFHDRTEWNSEQRRKVGLENWKLLSWQLFYDQIIPSQLRYYKWVQFNRDDIRGFLTEGATGLWPRAIPQNTGRCLRKPNPSYSVRPLCRFDYWPRLSVVAAVEEHEGSRFIYPKKAFSNTVIAQKSAFAFCPRHKISCISHRETVDFERRVRRFARQDALNTNLSERCKFKCDADYTIFQVDYFATIVDLNDPRRFQHPWDEHSFTLRNYRQNRDTRVRYDRSVDNVRCKFPNRLI